MGIHISKGSIFKIGALTAAPLFALGFNAKYDLQNLTKEVKYNITEPAPFSTNTSLENLNNAGDLFGVYAALDTPLLKQKTIPKTTLKLHLVAIFKHSDEGMASALIRSNNVSKRYFSGDNIPGGATLKYITKHSIVIRRGGKDEKLSFSRISPLTE